MSRKLHRHESHRLLSETKSPLRFHMSLGFMPGNYSTTLSRTIKSTFMARPVTAEISPFFIVSNVDRTINFYREQLGFEATFQQPARSPFFAILRRDGAQLFVKSEADVAPLPNPKRHLSMRWDAYIYAPNPDALAAEFAVHGVTFSAPLNDTDDGLRGF